MSWSKRLCIRLWTAVRVVLSWKTFLSLTWWKQAKYQNFVLLSWRKQCKKTRLTDTWLVCYDTISYHLLNVRVMNRLIKIITSGRKICMFKQRKAKGVTYCRKRNFILYKLLEPYCSLCVFILRKESRGLGWIFNH